MDGLHFHSTLTSNKLRRFGLIFWGGKRGVNHEHSSVGSPEKLTSFVTVYPQLEVVKKNAASGFILQGFPENEGGRLSRCFAQQEFLFFSFFV